MKPQILIFLLLIFTASCKTNPEYKTCDSFQLKTVSEYQADQIDHQIINAVIKQYHQNVEMAHLNQHTMEKLFVLTIDQLHGVINSELDPTLFQSILARNDTLYMFDSEQILFPLQIRPTEEIECLLEGPQGGWMCYYNKYPQSRGIFFFSRIGINPEGDRAIVEYSYLQWADGGEWCFVVLSKSEEGWVAEERIRVYRS
jgi:hypothetical protein